MLHFHLSVITGNVIFCVINRAIVIRNWSKTLAHIVLHQPSCCGQWCEIIELYFSVSISRMMYKVEHNACVLTFHAIHYALKYVSLFVWPDITICSTYTWHWRARSIVCLPPAVSTELGPTKQTTIYAVIEMCKHSCNQLLFYKKTHT